MMNKLFDLVKSLTQREKQYVSFYLTGNKTGGKEGRLLELFNKISRQKITNEKSFRKGNRVAPWQRNYSRTKNFLYEKMLRILHHYHEEESREWSLEAKIHASDILINKGLHGPAHELLEKARMAAEKDENQLAGLKILQRENILFRNRSFPKRSARNPDMFIRETGDLLDQYGRNRRIFLLDTKLLQLSFMDYSPRDPERLRRYEEIMADPLFSGESGPLSYFARAVLLRMQAVFFNTTQNDRKSLEYFRSAVSFMESDPEKIGKDPVFYLDLLRGLAVSLIRERTGDEALAILKKIRECPHRFPGSFSRFPATRTQIAETWTIEFEYYLSEMKYEKGLEILPRLEESLERYGEKMGKGTVVVAWANIFLLQFVSENLSGALYWLNKILNDAERDLRQDIYCFAHIYNLLLHFDLGNIDLLEYALKSSYRFLRKRKELYKMERIVLTYIPRLFRSGNTEIIREIFKEIKRKLEEIYKYPFEKYALDSVLLIPWLESKITDRPILDILKGKSKKANQ